MIERRRRRAARRRSVARIPTGCRRARPDPGPRGRRRRGPRPDRGRTRRRRAWSWEEDAPVECSGSYETCRQTGATLKPPDVYGSAERLAGDVGSTDGLTLNKSVVAPVPTSTTPTVEPSRSTVARSQTAPISISRCEMKITERSLPRLRPMTSRTRSVRLAGSAAVISSSIRMSGSMASARARSMIRSDARGRSRAKLARSRSGRPSSASQWRTASGGVCVSRRLDRTSRSGISDGSW